MLFYNKTEGILEMHVLHDFQSSGKWEHNRQSEKQWKYILWRGHEISWLACLCSNFTNRRYFTVHVIFYCLDPLYASIVWNQSAVHIVCAMQNHKLFPRKEQWYCTWPLWQDTECDVTVTYGTTTPLRRKSTLSIHRPRRQHVHIYSFWRARWGSTASKHGIKCTAKCHLWETEAGMSLAERSNYTRLPYLHKIQYFQYVHCSRSDISSQFFCQQRKLFQL